MTSPLTYWRTVRHLRREQIFGRLTRSLPRVRPAVEATPALRRATGNFGGPILRSGPIRRKSSFHFLNRTATIATSADWNNEEHAKLWLYNLHYFDWLREEAAQQRSSDDAALIDRWIRDNPIAQGTGWEPYPLSIRIVNWIVWLITTGIADKARIDSLAAQARLLARSVEYHLLGNHLFANAKALVFAGTFFEGKEADEWRALGLDLLAQEIPEQILPDGAHFELSPMYHVLILEDVLDLLGLAVAYPAALAAPFASLGLADVAARMTHWLRQIVHPDGEIPYFNDCAFGIAPSPDRIFEYAARRGVDTSHAADRGGLLQQSGYTVLNSLPFHLIFDCGRIGPDYLLGHAHADTLSFELSVGRDRVITNSGTSTYAPGPDREWERSTRAHATIEIDGANSAETWASFRVGRRPNVGPAIVGKCEAVDWIECWHDGYRHLAGSPIHRRRVTGDRNLVRITDNVDGRGNHSALGVIPIHPSICISETSDGGFLLQTPGGHCIEVRIDGPVEASIQPGRFAQGFGLTVPRPVIEWRWRGSLPLLVQTNFRLPAS